MSWDEPFVELAKKWCNIVQALSLKISHYVGIVVDNLSYDLFIFCDASIKAYMLLLSKMRLATKKEEIERNNFIVFSNTGLRMSLLLFR